MSHKRKTSSKRKIFFNYHEIHTMQKENLSSPTTNDMNRPNGEYVIVNAIQIASQCKANPMFIIREVVLEAVVLKQSIDWDKHSSLTPLLTLLQKAGRGDYQGAHAEGSNTFPKGRIGYADADDQTDYHPEDEVFEDQLKKAIDLLKSQGTSYQIIYDSLLQAVFDYGISISENPRGLTILLLNAVKDVFIMMADYELEQEEMEKQEKLIS